MSVIVKGMEMPTMPKNLEQWGTIPFIDVRIFADGSAVMSKGEKPYYKEQSAVSVPPHGRLIDADIFEKLLSTPCVTCKDKGALCRACGVDLALDILDNAPIVIEAEEENED